MTRGQFFAWLVFALLILLVITLIMKTNSGTLAPLEVKPLAVAEPMAKSNVPSEIVLREDKPQAEASLIDAPLVIPDRFAKQMAVPMATTLQARFDRAAT